MLGIPCMWFFRPLGKQRIWTLLPVTDVRMRGFSALSFCYSCLSTKVKQNLGRFYAYTLRELGSYIFNLDHFLGDPRRPRQLKLLPGETLQWKAFFDTYKGRLFPLTGPSIPLVTPVRVTYTLQRNLIRKKCVYPLCMQPQYRYVPTSLIPESLSVSLAVTPHRPTTSETNEEDGSALKDEATAQLLEEDETQGEWAMLALSLERSNETKTSSDPDKAVVEAICCNCILTVQLSKSDCLPGIASLRAIPLYNRAVFLSSENWQKEYWMQLCSFDMFLHEVCNESCSQFSPMPSGFVHALLTIAHKKDTDQKNVVDN